MPETVAAPAVTLHATAKLPSRHGNFLIQAYRVDDLPVEVACLLMGDISAPEPPLVRLHSECLTGDAFGSLRCDCGEQLALAMELVAEEGRGVILYLRQEGRGIGLVNKIRAYALQDQGMDTLDANLALGLPADNREYASAAAVLRHLGAPRVRLMTNNLAKCRALEENGVAVEERIGLAVRPNPANLAYLDTKVRRMGHLIELLELDGRPA
ncbi:MAG TPA: GTP cyclohydrolase II [Chloroflexota bacterium]|nr:GTP cyclohydrolase II [Chloroflexota bacterium]